MIGIGGREFPEARDLLGQRQMPDRGELREELAVEGEVVDQLADMGLRDVERLAQQADRGGAQLDHTAQMGAAGVEIELLQRIAREIEMRAGIVRRQRQSGAIAVRGYLELPARLGELPLEDERARPVARRNRLQPRQHRLGRVVMRCPRRDMDAMSP